MANRVLYCARETEGEGAQEEVVVEDSDCSHLPKPAAVVSCNHHSCPARYHRPHQEVLQRAESPRTQTN